MQAYSWKALLRGIPEEHVDNLMLMTVQGTEINVQQILRMDEDVVILRGRIAGSNDAGRIFILPYAHFAHSGFQRPLTDAQLQAIFGISSAAPPAREPEAPAVEPAAGPASPPTAPAPEPAAVPIVAAPTLAAQLSPNAAGLLARLPSKSKIIQRLRLRAGARDGANSPPKE